MLFLYLMSADSTEKEAETSSEKLVCESCGESFPCGSKLGKCWCFDIEVGAETLAKLKEDFKSCLCPDCLMRREISSPAIKSLR